MAKGILIAAMDFSAAPEDEFHDWYDLEHVPERLGIPGFINAERWIGIDNPKISLATYDLDSVGVLHSEPYVSIAGANSSPWTNRTARFRKSLMRMEGEQLFPGDKTAPGGAAAAMRSRARASTVSTWSWLVFGWSLNDSMRRKRRPATSPIACRIGGSRVVAASTTRTAPRMQ
jgi:hypothetical protein